MEYKYNHGFNNSNFKPNQERLGGNSKRQHFFIQRIREENKKIKRIIAGNLII